jgi:hypothetical protein
MEMSAYSLKKRLTQWSLSSAKCHSVKGCAIARTQPGAKMPVTYNSNRND